ncbi:hypothetical protein KUCAC02_037194, partial [Chaenocephalus aceratus]
VPITSKLKLEVTGHSGRGVFAPPHQQPCSPSQSCQPDYISAGRGDLRKGGCHKTNLYVSITPAAVLWKLSQRNPPRSLLPSANYIFSNF